MTEGFKTQPIHASIIEPWSLVNGSHPTDLLRAFLFLFDCFFGGVIGFMAAVYRSGRYSLRAILCPFKVSMCCALLAKSEARSECLSHSSVILWCEPPSASKNLKDFGARS
jgi:hypothetical protein